MEVLEQDNKIQESVTIIKDQIFKKKEEVVRLRLKQLGKLNVLRDINKKRFKKLMVEHHTDREEVWIDDGSWKGKRVVTFLNPTEQQMQDSELKFKLLYFFD